MTSAFAIMCLFLGALVCLANWAIVYVCLASGKHSSLVPLIGGLLLAIGCAQLESLRPYAVFAPLLDIGTLMLLWAIPKIIAEMWRLSRWNILHKFSGVSGGIAVDLIFYRHNVAQISLTGCRLLTEAPTVSGWHTNWMPEGDGFVLEARGCSGELRLQRNGDRLILTELAETETVANRALLGPLCVEQTQ